MNGNMPDKDGFFGNYGGSFVDDKLKKALAHVSECYEKAMKDESFLSELKELRRTYVGRPSPIYHAKRLSGFAGGAEVYLKREDLNHTGAHKINHCIGEALLVKHMGKKKIIAETGAGQHGVAIASAAALFGLQCDVYMGAIDVMKEASNVSRMKLLGAHVISVTDGTQTLKDAVDAAFSAYVRDLDNSVYCIGTVVGPKPFPGMVRDFQSVIGEEAREQFSVDCGCLPDAVVACVGGGSNAIGIFTGFIDDGSVALYGVEPAGKGLNTGKHAATLNVGRPGVIHGTKTYVIADDKGNPLPVYSVASGLDYPGVGPQHSYLKDIGRVKYVTVTDREAVESFYCLSRMEGIVPALESSHAVSYGVKLARQLGKGRKILVNLSGRGDKDVDFVRQHYPLYDYDGGDDSFGAFIKNIGEYR